MANTVRSARPCEVCGSQYRPTYHKQRTCGRACGAVLRFGLPKPIEPAKPKSTSVRYVNCAACDKLFVVRASSTQKCCSRPCVWAAGSGVRVPRQGSVVCGGCGDTFDVMLTTRPKRYCAACAVAVLREQRRRGKDRRRAVKVSAFVAPVYRKKIYLRDGNRCQLCHKKMKMDAVVPHPLAPTLDHIVPLAKGGTHEPANVQAAHFICNARKGDGGSGEQLLLIG